MAFASRSTLQRLAMLAAFMVLLVGLASCSWHRRTRYDMRDDADEEVRTTNSPQGLEEAVDLGEVVAAELVVCE
jgi:uncharacterized lipoprotein